MTKVVCKTKSVEETQDLAFQLGKYLKGPLCIVLNGDMGAGKTHFAQGFAKGLEIVEPITSPTFTIMNAYESGRELFYHFDLYRLEDEEELAYIGFDEYVLKGISLVEWANKFPRALPNIYLEIAIDVTGENERMITFITHGYENGELKEWSKTYVCGN